MRRPPPAPHTLAGRMIRITGWARSEFAVTLPMSASEWEALSRTEQERALARTLGHASSEGLAFDITAVHEVARQGARGQPRARLGWFLAVPAAILALVLWFASITDSPATRSGETTPTAEEMMATLAEATAAGLPNNALSTARLLIETYPGSELADSAAILLPQLEEEAERAEAAKRAQAAEALAAAKRRDLEARWAYNVSVDDMSGGNSRTAVIHSENTIEFDFPYGGPQRGRLMIRRHPRYGLDVVLLIDRGQFLCDPFDGCRISIRFDEGQAERWRATEPTNHSTTTLFINDASRFIQRMRNSSVVRIQPSVYQEGPPIFEFQVGGYDHALFAGPR
jgi:hypothetical protein